MLRLHMRAMISFAWNIRMLLLHKFLKPRIHTYILEGNAEPTPSNFQPLVWIVAYHNMNCWKARNSISYCRTGQLPHNYSLQYHVIYYVIDMDSCQDNVNTVCLLFGQGTSFHRLRFSLSNFRIQSYTGGKNSTATNH